ncbi:MAG: hypothetical protein ACRDA4_05000 [Filifactoraceae bacterium]
MRKVFEWTSGIVGIYVLASYMFKNTRLYYMSLFILLISQAILEIYSYRETKRKIHLIIPVTGGTLVVVFIILKVMGKV